MSSLKNPLLGIDSGSKIKLNGYGAVLSKLEQNDTFDDEIDIELQHKPNLGIVGPNYLRTAPSTDDFGDMWRDKNFANKVTRTGRQRKKLASRTKGGEFEAKRKKRRVNFICLCSELDLEGLFDAVLNLDGGRWEVKIYEDVLHIFQQQANFNPQLSPERQKSGHLNQTIDPLDELLGSTMEVQHGISATMNGVGGTQPGLWKEPSMDFNDIPNATLLNPNHSSNVLWSTGAKEVFIFEFGAIVFWGFRKGEEDPLITLIRKFIEQGEVSNEEINEEGDDMAFVTSSETDIIIIANDVITLPDNSSAKSRLSVSFAIAQSAVLGIFEGRVETKIKEFKYIPETLASNKDLRLTPKKLGAMIGEVYRIRHDVNLHSEILDTPDFFWKEEEAELVYRMTWRYLEMSARTDVLNTRVDMLRELLAVLQQREDNSSAVKLEWIVIWLIVVSAAIESMAIFVTLLKK